MGVHCHVKITGEWFEHSTSGWPNKIHVFYGPDTLNHCVTPFAPKEIWTPDLALTKRALYPWAIGAWSPSRGFDPRTLRLTASHSSDWVKTEWSGLGDSNTWPMEGYIILLQSIALPTELRPGKLPPVFETGLLDSKSKVIDHYTIEAIWLLLVFSLTSFTYLKWYITNENKPADTFVIIMGMTR